MKNKFEYSHQGKRKNLIQNRATYNIIFLIKQIFQLMFNQFDKQNFNFRAFIQNNPNIQPNSSIVSKQKLPCQILMIVLSINTFLQLNVLNNKISKQMKFIFTLFLIFLVYSQSTDSLNSPECNEYTNQKAFGKPTFSTSSDRNLDYRYFNGRIVAYKIRWFNGQWSKWFVPGINDLDWKFNEVTIPSVQKFQVKSPRRVWSYFDDHEHSYILCRK